MQAYASLAGRKQRLASPLHPAARERDWTSVAYTATSGHQALQASGAKVVGPNLHLRPVPGDAGHPETLDRSGSAWIEEQRRLWQMPYSAHASEPQDYLGWSLAMGLEPGPSHLLRAFDEQLPHLPSTTPTSAAPMGMPALPSSPVLPRTSAAHFL
jgi:hypothetical protein